jgi:hypothetical protein
MICFLDLLLVFGFGGLIFVSRQMTNVDVIIHIHFV